MVAIKSLISILPIFLAVTTALPGKVQVDGTNLGARGTVDVTSSSHDSDSNSNTNVGVNFYQDKNPDSHVKIDPNTCKGNAEIALMKWRSNCKAFNAIFRGSCYTHAPSEERCCPLAKGKSCGKYWPKKGEWAKCQKMRKDCGKDCHWKDLSNDLQWCWKYAPDM